MDKVPVVDQEKCIGCGACVAIAPKTFKLDDSGKVEVINPSEDSEEKINKFVSGEIKEAVEACPVGAIKIVKS